MDILKKIYSYAEPNLTLMSWMGAVGYPLYYYIWTKIFPQPYETLWLRLICSFLFLVMAVRKYLPEKVQYYLPFHYFITIGIGLPFFFCYMLLMNNWSDIWVMSLMSAIFLHRLLICNTRLMLAQAAIAFVLAYGTVYGLVGYHPSDIINWHYVPIFLFIYIFGSIFYSCNFNAHEIKVSTARSFGAGIAHEMRNPLGALRYSIDILKSILPRKENNNRQLNSDDINIINSVLDEANDIIHNAHETIDLLLTSINHNRIPAHSFKKYSIQSVIENALNSFNYRNDAERSSVYFKQGPNFDYLGHNTLLKYVIFNLLKNAFNYQKDENFSIHLHLEKHHDYNQLIIQDNGLGISHENLKHIFSDFYTTGKTGHYGIGLPFCLRVMHAFNGQIQCRSKLGEGTQFALIFPSLQSSISNSLKKQIISTKSILYIGQTPLLIKQMKALSIQHQFSLKVATLQETLKNTGQRPDYDLLLIESDNQTPHINQLLQIHDYTQTHIAYITPSATNKPFNRQVQQNPCLNTQQLLTQGNAIITELLLTQQIRNSQQYKTPHQGHQRILLVDDNHAILKLTTLLLEHHGYTVFQAHNGQQALEIIEQYPVDLILMDIEMPIKNGIETTRKIRTSGKNYHQIPIIGHTGDNTPSAIQRLLDSGMNDYLVKPSPKEELFMKLTCWLA
ncbi:MAG: CAI-1 autoinducer sensor kinase/phosphatase CqsS [Candidatus Celerinatantimonas neptuna]|nr:MAG: CAI-1 autoinducer sensor kinase/phosphatase CqsS [Candidatus Celerinatantimonas neptuna]